MNQQDSTSLTRGLTPVSPWQPGPAVRRRKGLAGMRLTQSRLAVLRALHENATRFLEVGSLQRAVQDVGLPIPLPTAYRILVEMEKARLVQSTRQGARVLYRQVFEEETGQPQFVCTQCGLAQALCDAALVAKLARCAAQQGFRISPSVTLAGLCAACTEKPASS